MRKKSRKLLIVLLFAIFVVSAPAVILFTMGYRYNWKKHKPEKTGILSVSSRPSGALVAIEGKVTGRTTPSSFSRLLPEDYALQLAKDGYLPWKKTLSIRSGETTFAKNITLFRDTLPRSVMDGDVLRASFAPAADRVALLVAGEEWTELRVVDLASEEQVLLSRFESDAFKDMSIEWSPDGAYVLLTGEHGTDGFIATAFDATGEQEARPLQDILPKPAWSMHWSGNGDQLIAGTRAGLYVFRLNDQNEPVVLSPFAVDGLVIGEDTALLRQTTGSVIIEYGPVSTPADRREAVQLPAGDYRFRSVRYPYAVLSDAKGGLWYADIQDGGYGRIGTGDDVVWDRSSSAVRALVCNDFEVALFHFATSERELLTRLGAPIGGCDWSPNADFILYSSNGTVSAIELDARGERNDVRLVDFARIGGFRVAPATGTLWFTGEVGNRRGLFQRPL